MKYKILIADDDLQLLTILSERLNAKYKEFNVITAKNGLEAILALQKQRFSILVTEIKMPKVNGMVLLGYIAKNFPELPCIIMSEDGKQLSKKKLIKEPLHFIDKPFQIAELAKLIFNVLQEKKKFGGILNGVPVAAFIDMIKNEKLECTCEIFSPQKGKGYLLFDKGKRWKAIYGELRGEAAEREIMQMKDATIKYGRLPRKKKKTPEESLSLELSAVKMEVETADSENN